MANIQTITSSCLLRRPRIVATRSDVVFYTASRGSNLATICPETVICEACWQSWKNNTDGEVPGQWTKTEIRRQPGITCDASDGRLTKTWNEVLASRSIQPLETELDRRQKRFDKCAAHGGTFSEMYEPIHPPSQLPPIVPPSYRPDMQVLICPKCHCDTVEATPLGNYFRKVPATTNSKCMMGSHAAIAHSLIVAASESNLEIFTSTAYAAIYFATKQPVKGETNCSDNGKWYNLDPLIENFCFCEACAYNILWAFSVIRPLVRPDRPLTQQEQTWKSQNGDPRVCDFSIASKRFLPTVLELFHAQANKSPTDFHTFASRIAAVQPCQGPRESPQPVRMYMSDTLQALDVCEDCWITQFEHSDFGGLFHLSTNTKRYPQNPEFAEYNLACDYASPRVKARLDSVVSDLGHGVTDSFNPFREWLAIRRFSLQKLVIQQWSLRKKQLLQATQQAHTHMLSLMYRGAGNIQSVAGTNDGYLHGNSSIGWHENESLATSAKLFQEASAMNGLQPLADVMQVEMQIQQLL